MIGITLTPSPANWSVFVHRFRDVDHRIRTECVHELGIWMNKLPQVYFDGAHLRYMGWALSDSVLPHPTRSSLIVELSNSSRCCEISSKTLRIGRIH